MTLRSAPRIAERGDQRGHRVRLLQRRRDPRLERQPVVDHVAERPGRDRDRERRALHARARPARSAKYDIFVTPHNSGYALLAHRPDRTSARGRTRSSTRSCRTAAAGPRCATRSFEREQHRQPDAERQRRPSRTCSRRRWPGGIPGGFLTTNGFSTIDERRRHVDGRPAAADLPVARSVPTSGTAQALPGGSVQTWPSPGNPGAPTYYADTERVAMLRRRRRRPRPHHRRHVPRRHRRGEGHVHRRALVLDVACRTRRTPRRRTCAPSTTRCSSTAARSRSST